MADWQIRTLRDPLEVADSSPQKVDEAVVQYVRGDKKRGRQRSDDEDGVKKKGVTQSRKRTGVREEAVRVHQNEELLHHSKVEALPFRRVLECSLEESIEHTKGCRLYDKGARGNPVRSDSVSEIGVFVEELHEGFNGGDHFSFFDSSLRVWSSGSPSDGRRGGGGRRRPN